MLNPKKAKLQSTKLYLNSSSEKLNTGELIDYPDVNEDINFSFCKDSQQLDCRISVKQLFFQFWNLTVSEFKPQFFNLEEFKNARDQFSYIRSHLQIDELIEFLQWVYVPCFLKDNVVFKDPCIGVLTDFQDNSASLDIMVFVHSADSPNQNLFLIFRKEYTVYSKFIWVFWKCLVLDSYRSNEFYATNTLNLNKI